MPAMVPPCQRAPEAAHSRQSMSGRAGVVRSDGAPRLRQQLAGVFAAVAEPIGQQEVEDLVAPVGRRRRVAAERRGALEQRVDVVERRGAGGGDDVAWRHAGLSRGVLKETTA